MPLDDRPTDHDPSTRPHPNRRPTPRRPIDADEDGVRRVHPRRVTTHDKPLPRHKKSTPTAHKKSRKSPQKVTHRRRRARWERARWERRGTVWRRDGRRRTGDGRARWWFCRAFVARVASPCTARCRVDSVTGSRAIVSSPRTSRRRGRRFSRDADDATHRVDARRESADAEFGGGIIE